MFKFSDFPNHTAFRICEVDLHNPDGPSKSLLTITLDSETRNVKTIYFERGMDSVSGFSPSFKFKYGSLTVDNESVQSVWAGFENLKIFTPRFFPNVLTVEITPP